MERPLLYLLRENEHVRDTYVEENIMSEDDLKILEDATEIPRTAEFIWIYQKLTERIREGNERIFRFQLSGFATDLYRPETEMTEYAMHLEKGIRSANKLVVVLCLEDGVVLDMNHGEYQLTGSKATLFMFPAYMWWRCKGKFLMCILSGDHFR
jgi:hypothetical protein